MVRPRVRARHTGRYRTVTPSAHLQRRERHRQREHSRPYPRPAPPRHQQGQAVGPSSRAGAVLQTKQPAVQVSAVQGYLDNEFLQSGIPIAPLPTPGTRYPTAVHFRDGGMRVKDGADGRAVIHPQTRGEFGGLYMRRVRVLPLVSYMYHLE